MIGETVSRYRILGKLGEGGMGVVYEAEDTRLKRTVALKFLPPALTLDAQAKARFIQEAQAAAALDHPNICPVFEIGEADGRTFIAMPRLKGLSLKERIAAGPLALAEALDIAVQVAEGLKEAHEKGIVHRDIKPANIMVTGKGQAKIMDFGLAKLTGLADVTKTLGVTGTVAYMSPEQARGEAVDTRTDIWSLGATLYEMLAGALPFGRKGERALIYSILHENPEPLNRLRPEIPLPLDRLVQKTLEKDRSRRHQSMGEVLADLRSVRASDLAASPPEKSILVLPFENISADPEQDYFCDGMTEELIADLSQIQALRVISRTSSMMFKGRKKDIAEIARDVHVGYVLEGSVRKAGNALRITAQLIDAVNDAHIWAEKYRGTLDDIFDIQEKVSQAIVGALKLKLTAKESEHLVERPIPNPLAYEFYLRARQEILKWTEAGLDQAVKYLQSGLDIAGENAILYAGLAYTHFQYTNIGVKDSDACRKQAEAYVEKAFALDSGCPSAHFVRALLIAWSHPVEGIKSFKCVLDENPNDFDALFVFSCILGTLGRKSAVRPLEERTIKIDPLNAAAHFHSGFNRLWEGKYDQARETLERLHGMFPADVLTKWSFALSLAYAGCEEKAGRIFEEVAKEQPGTLLACLGQAFKGAFEGRRDEALASLESNPHLKSPWDFQTAYWKTECLALIGEKEMALDCLELDVNLGMSNYPLMSELDPFLANIRGEERFAKLIARVKDEWDRFEV
jgi:serine/threonine protein kinase/tetratricopeptide (TPR) repeat protein